MSRTIYRYEIPVDDQWHAIALTGDVLHVDCRSIYVVELWAIHVDGPTHRRSFRAYGTGQPIPDGATHVGTTIAPGGHLVWHLMELP